MKWLKPESFEIWNSVVRVCQLIDRSRLVRLAVGDSSGDAAKIYKKIILPFEK